MKTMRKVFAMLMALSMILALAITANAEGETTTEGGSIVIENGTKGIEYKAYKIFDATYNTATRKTAYRTKDTSAFGTDSPFEFSTTADSEGWYYVVNETAPTIDQVKTWLEGKYSSFESTDGVFEAGNKINFGTLPFGYYYITSGLGSVVTIDNNTPNATLQDKNESSPFVDENGGKHLIVDDEKVSETDAAVGSTVSYQIDFVAKNMVQEEGAEEYKTVENYTITDTNEGGTLSIDTETLKVFVNGTELGSDAYKYTYTNSVLTINIPWAEETDDVLTSIYAAGENGNIPVVVTYDATVLAAAAGGSAKNTVTIAYDGKNITVPQDDTTVNTYSFNLEKVDNTGAKLEGAEFTLKDGETAVELIAEMENDAIVAYHVFDGKEEGKPTTKIVAGAVVVKGLDYKDSYTLTETKAPEGYNMKEDATAVAQAEGETKAYSDVSVVNQQGVELPSTGGIGTTIFTVVGATLMIGAAVLFVTKKRSAI